jgi:hypothetical protein
MADFGVGEALALGAVVSAATAAAGAVAAGNAQKAAAAANANVQQQNAAQAVSASDAQAAAADRANRQKMGQVEAAYGASGVDPSGTPLDVMADNATQSRLDALSIKYNGTVGANRSVSQSNIDMFQGDQAQTAGYIGAGATLLNAGTKYAGSYAAPSSSAGSGPTNQMTTNGFAVGPV